MEISTIPDFLIIKRNFDPDYFRLEFALLVQMPGIYVEFGKIFKFKLFRAETELCKVTPQ